MANLSSLLHKLRERIARQPNHQNDDDLKALFRDVLPNLLRTYVVPSADKHREVVAILKLSAHVANNFPGVFYHGKPSAVLPVIARILPFFAESAFKAQHGVIFETVVSLLSLLRTGDRDAYRLFFMDAMLLVEDLVDVALVCERQCYKGSRKVSLKCFTESFSGAWDEPSALCDLPQCCKADDSYGILINLTGNERCQLFASFAIKVLSKCLTEGTLYVEGLLNTSCVLAICKLLCYGDADLHMVCFDFVHLVGAMSYEIVPAERLIQLITIILHEGKGELPVFRNTMYDSSMGGCLHLLHSRCPVDVVRSTATDLVNVFPQSLLRTRSQELKGALCCAYSRVVKYCPPHIWRPEFLIKLLYSSSPIVPLIECFEVALSSLQSNISGGEMVNDGGVCLSTSNSSVSENPRVGEKRPQDSMETSKAKLQKFEGEFVGSGMKCEDLNKLIYESPFMRDKEYANYMHSSLKMFVQLLKPLSDRDNSLGPEVALTALSTLCIVFCKYPCNNLLLQIFQHMCEWVPWIDEQVQQGLPLLFDLSIFLDAVNNLLLLKGSISVEEEFLNSISGLPNMMRPLLRLPWSNSISINSQPPWKAKCLSLQVLSKIGPWLQNGNDLDILDLGLLDEMEEVRREAVYSMPIIVMWCGYGLLTHMFKRLEILEKEMDGRTKKIIPHALGYLACLYGSYCTGAVLCEGKCKLYFQKDVGKQDLTVDGLLRVWCSKCDTDVPGNELNSKILHLPNVQDIGFAEDYGYNHLQSLFFKLLYDESSEDIQVSCVDVIQRILLHVTESILLTTRCEWLKCIDYLLLHRIKAVREAFCAKVGFFLEEPILNCLFLDGEPNKTKEQKFMEKLKDALSATDDPLVHETLLEAAVNVMNTVDVHSQFFFFSLILLIDQLDNPHLQVRIIASRLIRGSCYFHTEDGYELLPKVLCIRNELYDYLSSRLASSPKIVEEFALAVLDIETEKLVKKMVPVVLPKLIVTQKGGDEVITILHELAKCLNTDMVQLIVNWLPKVLAYALHRAERQDLLSVLQFYHEKTGSDNQEIFSAALPALLDELVCFTDEDVKEINKRLMRVPQMIKEVARILTGNEDLPGFLRNHFVGLLNSIDRKMLHTKDISLQRQAVKRIEMLIDLMGSHLSTYVPKLMVLLMHAIDKEPLQGDGLSVFHYFIKQLALVSPSSTKHVISQVFAALVPFLEREKEKSSSHSPKIVEILEELVTQNRAILKEHIREFPPLPNIPVLSKVNSIIQEARGPMSLKDQLLDIVDGLNHENLNVRYMVASELSKLLNLRREDVMALITKEGDPSMDVMSSLITSLLRGCAEESRTMVGQRLKLICADCLGALGAVDPAKIKGFSNTRFKIACSDDDLIFELIHKHLARAFRAAPDTIIQDSAALAIQELLKIAGCEASLDENVSGSLSKRISKQPLKSLASTPKSSGNCNDLHERGQRLWNRFSDYVKEIIAPCLTSRFQLPNSSDSASSGPIYRPSMSFRRWIFFWIKKLTVHAIGSRASIFKACRGIVRHDVQIAMYLLPYLVLHAVCHGTEEARHGIAEEILFVLRAAASESNNATVHGISSGHNEVCIQAVFTLLDNLGQWVYDVEQDLALSLSVQTSNSRQQALKLKEQNDSEQMLMQCKHVSELLAAIPKVTLARASFRCHAYARSLLYFESYVREKSGSFNPSSEKSGIFEDEDISFLMEIYSGLDEPDGLSGFASLRKAKSLQDHFLINKKAGNWAEVLTSCEQALQMEPTSVQRHSDVLNCLLNMYHLQGMVTYVTGLMSRIPEYRKMWCMQGIQAAWRLGRWDLMDEYLNGADKEGLICSNAESNASFDMDVAMILQAMMKKDQFSVDEKIALSKQSLIGPLAAAGMDSYARAYPFVVKLHMLRELEEFNFLLGGESFLEKSLHLDELQFPKLTGNWENRLKLTQPSLWAREPLLAFRRLVFCASGVRDSVGNCWIQYAKLCRSAGHYETANRAILEARVVLEATMAPNVNVEKAKLLWSTRRADGAIAELQQSLLSMPVEVVGSSAISSITSLSLVPLNPPPLLSNTQFLNETRDVAKTLLLYSRWIHYTGQKKKEDMINLYSRVKELQPKWENGYFYMAKYCDELLVDARKRQEDKTEPLSRVVPSNFNPVSSTSLNAEKPWWSDLPDVLLFYAKGLHRGHKNLFQALPRLLTLWFDFGSVCHPSNVASTRDMKTIHGKVMNIMRGCLKDLPTYQWLTVLPQLVSRICHQNEDTVRLVKHIITSVLQQYPQQALWIMAAVTKSQVSSRKKAAAEIIQAARNRSTDKDVNSLFTQFATLIDHLIKLCNHNGQPRARTINISTEFSALKRMMPVDIIMPTQQSLTVNLPSYYINQTDSVAADTFSFTDLPTISGISDEADILSSLQRPKKMVALWFCRSFFWAVMEVNVHSFANRRMT
ncbi:serine/threonine-protein kinase ATR isoform X2 [Ipomoea triloba]|uniref:serine/threonine-protein kinase ATR isoform X2 n=1 Tax=Ipomoea triloba TaxID=35885 RepID=UPI00125CF597|nr:serine/threonine-protein kinase ATR isoform X2 [Ipomoea triloba]